MPVPHPLNLLYCSRSAVAYNTIGLHIAVTIRGNFTIAQDFHVTVEGWKSIHRMRISEPDRASSHVPREALPTNRPAGGQPSTGPCISRPGTRERRGAASQEISFVGSMLTFR